MSKLTGGKFANGAITSAMQWWYNAEKMGEVQEHRKAEKIFNDLVARGISENNSGLHQQALNFAAGYWGIDFEDRGEFFYPKFDSALKHYPLIKDNRISVSLSTLQEGLGFTGSTLFHEMDHIKNGSRYIGQFGMESSRLLEVSAYDAQLKHNQRFRLTERQVGILQSNRNDNCVNIHIDNRTSRGITC
ncbi:hypothetical protein H5162_20970 [Pseudoalteromonas sp. SR41-8]|uniref:hypothetical protein n=1 Tax=Pseudoalteromonas sp. SR41-8 TaxID=2760946 RepID=UPI001602A684|nr:hypothetical protein [Pseudoalteromonas sp. SR41-8]MBB1311883.1 hypothetical protein [Pseudoalteromonas sp. SR41-8]